jgi:hypothetical protein
MYGVISPTKPSVLLHVSLSTIGISNWIYNVWKLLILSLDTRRKVMNGSESTRNSNVLFHGCHCHHITNYQKSTDGVVDFPCSSVYAEIRSVNMHVIQIVVRDSYPRTIFVHALSKIHVNGAKLSTPIFFRGTKLSIAFFFLSTQAHILWGKLRSKHWGFNNLCKLKLITLNQIL